MSTDAALPPEAFAVALTAVPSMTLARLGALLREHPPEEAWAVVRGEALPRGAAQRLIGDPKVSGALGREALRVRPEALWQRCLDVGATVLMVGSAEYPALLAEDHEAPPVLFVRGSLGLLEGRRVAMVGTRNATAQGRQAARAIAEGLGAAGVHVVSGLARGIDGVAHRAVLGAGGPGRPIGVVATGLDVPYPPEHAELWAMVAEGGLLISEVPPGTPPAAWRFPQRNRIVAALAEAVVVVESRERGGSLITADAALERGVPLLAVPGSPANRAAAGTNALLRDGATPVTEAADVLTLLQLDHSLAGVPHAPEHRRRPRPEDLPVYRSIREQPRTLEGVAIAAGLSLVDAAMGLGRLEADGWVSRADGWFEAVGSPLR